MARNGNPDDEFYSDPTQAANYSELGSSGQAYSEVPPQPDYTSGYNYPTGDYPTEPVPAEPWYRKPAALVGLGALAVVVAGLVVYALVSLFSHSPDTSPTGNTTTPTTTVTTTTAPITETTAAPVAPLPTYTETVTAPPTATTTAPETTTDTPTTTTAPSVSTVTETVTPTRTRPLFPLRPGENGPGPFGRGALQGADG
ncbi:MAG TPA: hypothetical protein VFW21_08990 [Mycobacterium sp.]|nr:hypothetical protein [Mycobacterium sp.]